MNKHIFKVLKKLSESQFQLQNIRQLLCEQIQFTSQAAYQQIIEESYSQVIDLESLLIFLEPERNVPALQSILKFYSQNQLRITIEGLESIIVARWNKLIQKLVRERDSTEDQLLPRHLVNYLKKLWQIEEQLHSQLNKMKNEAINGIAEKLKKYKKDGQVNQEQLKKDYLSLSQHSCQECPEIAFQLALRYLKRGDMDSPLLFPKFVSVFVPHNCNTIKQYLNSKEEAYRRIQSKQKAKSPFLHKEFHKLKNKADAPHFCFRQIKSVQDHIRRGNNDPTAKEMKEKIYQFTKKIAGQLLKFFQKIKKIIKYTNEINVIKKRLIENHECSFSSLFKEITRNKILVPSQLQHYLQTIGIQVQLPALFSIFKKHGQPLTGKMNAKSFIVMFLVPLLPQEYVQKCQEEFVNPNFRAAAIACILRQVQLQTKIQKVKQNINENMQLRQIFDSFDPDKKGRISRTDFEIVYKKITGENIKELQLQVLWGRMNRNIYQYTNYDTFMYEMLPRTKKRTATNKALNKTMRH